MENERDIVLTKGHQRAAQPGSLEQKRHRERVPLWFPFTSSLSGFCRPLTDGLRFQCSPHHPECNLPLPLHTLLSLLPVEGSKCPWDHPPREQLLRASWSEV